MSKLQRKIIPTEIPFFTVDGNTYIPTEASRGPWAPDSLNGRAICGLLGHEIERLYGQNEFLPARMTVDMYRLSRFSPITIESYVVRDSHRIRVVDAEFLSDGKSIARARCQFLKQTTNPKGNEWSPPNWNVPSPDEIIRPEGSPSPVTGLWDVRQITGPVKSSSQRAVWLCEVRTLVEQVGLTPFVRAALAADYASPLSNFGDEGLAYINTDVTLYLHRLPIGPWIGMQVVDHHATLGISTGGCFLYDTMGAIGSVSIAALAHTR